MRVSKSVFLILALTIGLSAAPSRATASWIETFTGGFDQTWSFFDNDGNSPPSDTSLSTAGDKLTMLDNLTLTPDQSVAGLVVGAPFSDVRVQATVIPMMGNRLTTGAPAPTNNDVFIAARSNGVEAYLLSFDFDDGDVDLVRVDNVGALHGLANINNPGWFTPGASYQLDLRILGSELRGRVLDMDGNLLDVLTATDSTLAGGLSGLGAALNADLAQANMTRIAAMFDNVSSTAIPEPSSLILAGVSGLAAVSLIRRRAN